MLPSAATPTNTALSSYMTASRGVRLTCATCLRGGLWLSIVWRPCPTPALLGDGLVLQTLSGVMCSAPAYVGRKLTARALAQGSRPQWGLDS
jgi:hypothetical protein